MSIEDGQRNIRLQALKMEREAHELKNADRFWEMERERQWVLLWSLREETQPCGHLEISLVRGMSDF